MIRPAYMQVLEDAKARLAAPPVVVLGNFDGVHLGHQALCQSARAFARGCGAPSVALSFEPHPISFFGKKSEEALRLTDAAHKLDLLRGLGLDEAVNLPFDADMANLSPEAFVRAVLVEGLQARAVWVGYDFNFGKNRAGSTRDLQALAADQGVEVFVHEAVQRGGEPVSSTRIRKALAAGEVELARSLLGRPHALRGEVVHGDQRGRALGFPTLNQKPKVGMMARHGVYVTLARRLCDPPGLAYPAISNLGARPTVGEGLAPNLETFVLAGLPVDADWYGVQVEVSLLEFVRDERKFDSFDLLKAQIERDLAQARAHHGL